MTSHFLFPDFPVLCFGTIYLCLDIRKQLRIPQENEPPSLWNSKFQDNLIFKWQKNRKNQNQEPNTNPKPKTWKIIYLKHLLPPVLELKMKCQKLGTWCIPINFLQKCISVVPGFLPFAKEGSRWILCEGNSLKVNMEICSTGNFVWGGESCKLKCQMYWKLIRKNVFCFKEVLLGLIHFLACSI